MKKIPWRDFLLVGVLILFDISMHPLTGGPDRLIHDPAVYRINDPSYLPGDWYTEMAVKSGVYFFYAKLIAFGQLLHIPEEFWRILLYLVSLAILFYALIKIARLFTKNILAVPLLVLFHALISTGANQPVWLYGPFMQIDGGFAPRSIGVAVSFLALYFVLRGSLVIPALLLGVATLIHVSNSFIIFSLFLLVWVSLTLMTQRPKDKLGWYALTRKLGIALGVYLLAGGWFTFYVASGTSGMSEFATEQFIWSWIYLRAPYMALPLVTQYWWLRFVAHVVVIVVGWFMLRQRLAPDQQWALNSLALVGLGAVAYFFIFYLFAFIWLWLPGFQFYSIRVVYLVYFTAYLFMSVLFLLLARDWLMRAFGWLRLDARRYMPVALAIAAVLFLTGFSYALGPTYRQPSLEHLTSSRWRLLDASGRFSSRIPAEYRAKLPPHATFHYLATHQQPFLAPPAIDAPTWRKTSHYLPNVASFKSFGFTVEGLPEWFQRINDISQGYIEQEYQRQKQAQKFEPVQLDWQALYSELSASEVEALAERYDFQLFLTYRDRSYPFELLVEDDEFRLYRVSHAPR